MIDAPYKNLSIAPAWIEHARRSDFINYYGIMAISDNGENIQIIAAGSIRYAGVTTDWGNWSINKQDGQINTIFKTNGFLGLYDGIDAINGNYKKLGSNLYTIGLKIVPTHDPIYSTKTVIVNNITRVINNPCYNTYNKTFFGKGESDNELYLIDEFIKVFPEQNFYYSSTSIFTNNGFKLVGSGYLGGAPTTTDLVDRTSQSSNCGLPQGYFTAPIDNDNGITCKQDVVNTGYPYWRLSIQNNVVKPQLAFLPCNTANPNFGYVYSKNNYCIDLSSNNIPYSAWVSFGNSNLEDALVFCGSNGLCTVIYRGLILSVYRPPQANYSSSAFLDSDFILWVVCSDTISNPNVILYKTDLSAILKPLAKIQKSGLIAYNIKNDTRPVSLTRGFIS